MEERPGFFSRITGLRPIRFILDSIRNKLLAAFLLLALVPLVALGLVSYTTASNALNTQTLNQLEAVETIKTGQIENWIADRKGDALFARNLVVVKGSPGVNEGLAILSQYKRDQTNPAYVEAASRAESVLGAFAREIGGGGVYDDIMLLDPTGDVVFALDPGSRNTNEADNLAFQNGLKTLYFGDMRYNPVHKEVDLRVAAPVLDDDRKTIGVLMLEINLQAINDIMGERTGLGQSGETYLVGPDKLFRSDSRFRAQLGVETTILNAEVPVDTEAARGGLAGQHGTQVINDYRRVPVLSSWSPLTVQEPTALDPDGVKWVVIAEIDQAEVQQPVVNLALITLGLVLGATILVILVAFLLSGALVRQIRAIMQLFSQIGIGDFSARTPVLASDELGTLALSLNAMLDNTLTLIQSREERDAIQASIMKLLDEVGDVAQGDLTREAEVTADVTGAIADAFNFMIGELRRIISHVQDATLQVSASANEIQTTAEHLAQGSESQAAQIVDTSAAIDEMAVSIQQVSENAALAATVAEQALANARQGTRSVQDTIGAMGRIRDQVQETAKRIKRLGESSQEIGEIVQLIDDIADRTSILALNASIQAAMAGEAGRGFAIVAEEVERLAERSTAATRQIDTLVKTIQGETNETVAAMEDSTREVVEGSRLANQAGQALTEIESVSHRLAELIQSISLASKQQARGAESLSTAMSDISEVTQQTAAGIKQATVSISNLAVLADDLRASVSAFKLPAAA